MANWGKKRDGRGLGVAFIDYSGSQLAGIAEVSSTAPTDRSGCMTLVHYRLRRRGCSPTTWWPRREQPSSGLHRDAAIDSAPEVMHPDLSVGAVDRHFGDAGKLRAGNSL